jgi:peptide/nickel transport system substrate-binding protein
MSFLKKIFGALTNPERIAFALAGIAATISLVIVLSIAVAQSTIIVPTAGGSFTEGALGQPEYINPVSAKSELDLDLVKMVYSNVSDIATNISSSTGSAGGKTWTVRLKENLHWQDGEQLTSDDIIFTVQAIQDPDAGSPLAGTWQGVTVSRDSELEVQFTLPAPNAFFLSELQNLYIVPKHLFADIPPGNWRLSDYNLKPIGSGPYEFTSYDRQPNGFITDYHLAAWNDYFNTRPLIQNFDFTFFSNKNDLIKSFNTAQIDGFAADINDLPQIERPYHLSAWEIPTYYAVFWNQGNNSVLQDNTVREALKDAVDRNAIVTNVLHNEGSADYGPVPPYAPYAAAITATTSIDDASTTLTNAHWILGSDGFRTKTDKKGNITPLSFMLTVPNIGFLVDTASALKADWQSIGVKVTIATDTAQNIAENEIPNRSYDALLFGNTLGPNSDLNAFWNSSERFSPGLNLAIYGNGKADQLMATIRTTLGDASRTQMFTDLQNIITNDNPALFIYSPDSLYVDSNSVRGITLGFLPDPSDRLREVPQWYLNTARVLK